MAKFKAGDILDHNGQAIHVLDCDHFYYKIRFANGYIHRFMHSVIEEVMTLKSVPKKINLSNILKCK